MTEPPLNDKKVEDSGGDMGAIDIATSMAGLYIDQVDPSQPTPDGTCHFFRLPPELREMVYEYVLTEPKALFWLPQSQYFEEKIKVFRNQVYGEGEIRHGKPWYHPRPDLGDSRFPMFSSGLEACTHVGVESNQLKYVCRQLHKETSGLGLKFNTLSFSSSVTSWPVTKYFGEFIKDCAPKRLAQIRSVELNDHWYECEEGQERDWLKKLRGAEHDPRQVHPKAMFDFLRAYPRADVVWAMGPDNPYWRWKFEDLFKWGCSLRFAMSGCRMEHLIPPSSMDADTERWGLEHRNGAALEELNAPNLNIFPPRSMEFNEAMIIDQADVFDPHSEWIQRHVREGMRAYVAELKRWFEKGILSEPEWE